MVIPTELNVSNDPFRDCNLSTVELIAPPSIETAAPKVSINIVPPAIIPPNQPKTIANKIPARNQPPKTGPYGGTGNLLGCCITPSQHIFLVAESFPSKH